MRALGLATVALVASVAISAPASAVEAGSPRCVGNGTLDAKYCVDTEGSCLLASYSSAAGSRCLIRNP